MTETNLEYCYSTSDASHTNGYLWPTIRRLLPDAKQSSKLFELGCGNGYTANQLSLLGYDVTAIDTSNSGIAQGREAYPHLKLATGSAYDDLASQYGQFSIAISLEVIEHLYDPRQYARTIYNLLEPGGVGIISTPYHGYLKNLVMALTGKLDHHFTALWDGGHIKFFSPTTLTILLSETGFTTPEIYRVGRIPPLAKSMIACFQKPKGDA